MAELIGLDAINAIYRKYITEGYRKFGQEKTLDGYYKIYYIEYVPDSQWQEQWNKIGYLRPGA